MMINTAKSWSTYGHLVTASVAHCILEQYDPIIIDRVEDILSDLHTNQTRNEMNHSFVEASVFADYIKTQGGQWQQSWHYNDLPLKPIKAPIYVDDILFNYKFLQIKPRVKLEYITVDSALKQSIIVLNASIAGQSEDVLMQVPIYKTVRSRYNNQQEAISVILRLLIHYIGDISQPLHTSNNNDRGGNDFPLKYHYGVDELHALWDTSIYLFAKQHPTLPLNESDWSQLSNYSCSLLNQFQFDSDPLDVDFWLQQSHDEASDAYWGIQKGQTVSLEYIMKNQKTTLQKLTLAGYRIANVLQQLFKR